MNVIKFQLKRSHTSKLDSKDCGPHWQLFSVGGERIQMTCYVRKRNRSKDVLRVFAFFSFVQILILTHQIQLFNHQLPLFFVQLFSLINIHSPNDKLQAMGIIIKVFGLQYFFHFLFCLFGSSLSFLMSLDRGLSTLFTLQRTSS